MVGQANDRQEENILIVDNSIISFAYQFSNGIPIKAYTRQLRLIVYENKRVKLKFT